MSETDVVTIGNALPRIRSVTAHEGYRVAVTWEDGARSVVDLAPLVLSMKFYAPLRNDADLFKTVHVTDHGNAVAWGSRDEIDMAATSVRRLAEETMTPHDFKAFMKRHGYTLDSVAAELGISRRQAAYYSSERGVPRYIALACRYLDGAASPVGRGERRNAMDYLSDHAALYAEHAESFGMPAQRPRHISDTPGLAAGTSYSAETRRVTARLAPHLLLGSEPTDKR